MNRAFILLVDIKGSKVIRSDFTHSDQLNQLQLFRKKRENVTGRKYKDFRLTDRLKAVHLVKHPLYF